MAISILEFQFLQAYWGPVVATFAMLFGSFIAWLFLKASRSSAPATPTEEKEMTYGCGEVVKSSETQADSEKFYSPIKQVFGGLYDYIRPGHSGRLNTYLLWVISGFVVIMAWIMVQLG